MKLLRVLESILIESRRIKLDSFKDDDGDIFNVIATIHSQEGVNQNFRTSRADIDSIGEVIDEYQDIFSKVTSKLINRKFNMNKMSSFSFLNSLLTLLNAIKSSYLFFVVICESMNFGFSSKFKTSIPLYPCS